MFCTRTYLKNKWLFESCTKKEKTTKKNLYDDVVPDQKAVDKGYNAVTWGNSNVFCVSYSFQILNI